MVVRWGQQDAVESRIEVGVGVPCDRLPGFPWVHGSGLDLTFALSWHGVLVYVGSLDRLVGTSRS